ncbi:MAG: TRAP transporter substrate-binding protein [Deltaproteobacteria bacterium]|nr:TRAP transporter substrate-binding protein [Deltaproteobacteria bacterium]MBW2207368.1 TRAP transporter substrate-binding protein [Deltaproteobacteria bacterium]
MEKRKLFSLTWSLVIIFTLVAFFTVSANQALASSEKPIELSFASHVPPKAAPYHAAFLPWAKEIEKRSNGRVKIKFYLSQTLVKARDAYDGVKNGIADITWTAFSFSRGRFPLSSVMELPYLVKSTYAGAHVLTDLYKKFPEMRAEVKDVHLLHLWTTMPYELHTVKKPIYKLEDIKGMKLATQPGAITVLEAAGAVPVTMPGPKIYTTVEKGVADGSALAWGAFKAYKLVEITKYHTNVHLAALPYCTIMNKNKWNSLPKDVQKVITDVTNEMMPDKLCAAVTAEGVKGRKSVLERKQEIYDMPPKERARWVATAQPAQDKWVKSMEAKGLPGRAVLDEAIKLMKAYK